MIRAQPGGRPGRNSVPKPPSLLPIFSYKYERIQYSQPNFAPRPPKLLPNLELQAQVLMIIFVYYHYIRIKSVYM